MPRTLGGTFTLQSAPHRAPKRRKHSAGWVAGGLALLLGGLGAAYYAYHAAEGTACQARALGRDTTLAPDQMANAATIVAIAGKRELPARAATIALATAMQESKLRNITYGDRDSLGLFQQRPSQGWGTREEVLDPEHAANAFYDALEKIPDYEHLRIGDVAQRIQRSAVPRGYEPHEGRARILASALSGHSPGGVTCDLSKPVGANDPDAFRRLLDRDLGLAADSLGQGTYSVRAADARAAWGVAGWAVAHAADQHITRVRIGDQEWNRTAAGGHGWQPAGGPSRVSTRVEIDTK